MREMGQNGAKINFPLRDGERMKENEQTEKERDLFNFLICPFTTKKTSHTQKTFTQ